MTSTLSKFNRICVTGANGFVGNALCQKLYLIGQDFTPVTRQYDQGKNIAIGSIGPDTDWSQALTECDSVIHLAARVHVMHDTEHDPLAAFRAVNTFGTLQLARQAAKTGVKRFLFMSSIKVNGEETINHPFTEIDTPRPSDAYSVSKWEAEQGLMAIAQETGMEVVIVRPPLVYGPNVGANFLRLMQLVHSGIPLPFGAIRNLRSLIYVHNLVDAIIFLLNHPQAADQTFLVSDGENISTPDLIRRLAIYMKKQAWLVPVPRSIMNLPASIVGKSPEVQRLFSSLAVDSSLIRQQFGWAPPYSLDDGLSSTVEWFLENKLNF
ncbi:SDR family oxidoreductase [Chitinivorax sp. B]|uniref:UDP-glucose 4-epimerase family protein n=1 Tax=Chitinivorax sp. B TaxID=2502235 RepID=UPI0010F62881|nr:SDR family oxidoreductase [Chitinivorax sp. B]